MSAYLTYEPASVGTLCITWTEKPVAGAILSAKPTSTVPAHKFKGNGKSEITRGVNDSKKFFQGVCSFVKQVAAFKSEIKAEENAVAPFSLLVVLLQDDHIVVHVDTKTKVSLVNKKAVAAVKKECLDYNAKVLDLSLFISKASQAGGGSEKLSA